MDMDVWVKDSVMFNFGLLLHFLSFQFLEFKLKKFIVVIYGDTQLVAQFRTLRQKEQYVQILIFTSIDHLIKGHTVCNF